MALVGLRLNTHFHLCGCHSIRQAVTLFDSDLGGQEKKSFISRNVIVLKIPKRILLPEL